jgi:RNA polymerase sigma-70 factor (ECF subfamily)
MPDVNTFRDLMARVCRGDARAAEELVGQFEAQVRLEVQMRLRDPRLRRLLDAADACQSVMLSFFVRARLGEYDISDPNELQRLLAGMARNKVAAQARRHSAGRRDFRRAAALAGADAVPAGGGSPSQVVAADELLGELRARLSAEEGRIAELRGAGRSWAEVAAELGGSADGRRVQFQRAVARVSRELGLEDADT